jgi:hypothetical protein
MEIINEGSIIVVLKDSSLYNNWENYCLEQYQSSNRQIVPKYLPGGQYNIKEYGDFIYGWIFSKREDWRYATEEEIKKYNTIGPYQIKSESSNLENNSYYEIF